MPHSFVSHHSIPTHLSILLFAAPGASLPGSLSPPRDSAPGSFLSRSTSSCRALLAASAAASLSSTPPSSCRAARRESLSCTKREDARGAAVARRATLRAEGGVAAGAAAGDETAPVPAPALALSARAGEAKAGRGAAGRASLEARGVGRCRAECRARGSGGTGDAGTDVGAGVVVKAPALAANGAAGEAASSSPLEADCWRRCSAARLTTPMLDRLPRVVTWSSFKLCESSAKQSARRWRPGPATSRLCRRGWESGVSEGGGWRREKAGWPGTVVQGEDDSSTAIAARRS